MKNYKNYINEDNNYHEIANQQAIAYQNTLNVLTIDDAVEHTILHCQDFINNPKIIGRNIKDSSINYFFSYPIKRRSRDNANFYTLILDNSPQWKGYPKRSNSFICTLNCVSSDYYVIPEDDSLWGIVPDIDIYFGFKELGIYSLNHLVKGLIQIAKYCGIELLDDSYINMKNSFNLFQTELYSKFNKENLKEQFWELNLHEGAIISNYLISIWGGNIFKYLVKTLNPVDNGFKLNYYNDIIEQEFKRECWTESPCLFIKRSNMIEYLEKLSKETSVDMSNFIDEV
jgi:hypothetical protein